MADIILCDNRIPNKLISYDAVINYELHGCSHAALTSLIACLEWDMYRTGLVPEVTLLRFGY